MRGVLKFRTGPVLLILLSCGLTADGQPRVIDGKRYHLGTAGRPEWEWFQGKAPDGQRLDIRFQATKNAREATLFIRQDDVKVEWKVQLNGRELGRLFLMESALVHTLQVPPGVLRDGDNTLSIIPEAQGDDDVVVAPASGARRCLNKGWSPIRV